MFLFGEISRLLAPLSFLLDIFPFSLLASFVRTLTLTLNPGGSAGAMERTEKSKVSKCSTPALPTLTSLRSSSKHSKLKGSSKARLRGEDAGKSSKHPSEQRRSERSSTAERESPPQSPSSANYVWDESLGVIPRATAERWSLNSSGGHDNYNDSHKLVEMGGGKHHVPDVRWRGTKKVKV